jgi:hypothetical protein
MRYILYDLSYKPTSLSPLSQSLKTKSFYKADDAWKIVILHGAYETFFFHLVSLLLSPLKHCDSE